MRRAALVFAILVSPYAIRPALAGAPSAALTVRVYNSSTAPAGDLAETLATAQRILDAAGVSVEWLDCPHRAADCAVPMGRADATVRIVSVPVPHSYRGLLPMGESVIEPQAHSGSLATIYADRVAWLARAAYADARVLMGRAIAHEIGHLLLGTNSHSRSGLMRARWSEDELRHEMPIDWVFTPGDIRRIRESIEARAVVQSAATNVMWGTAPAN